MILPILRYGDPILRQKGARVEKVTEEIRLLIRNMIETMDAARGVGLAAQQIGRPLQVAVVDITGIKERESKLWIDGKSVEPESIMPLIMINPQISGTKTKVLAPEGCLSFPGVTAEIARSQRVKVKCQTLKGPIDFEAGGLLGRAVQHEYDHLQGKLFIDLMSAETRKELRDEIDAIKTTVNEE